MRAHVVVLAGPSGAGKSRLAERLGLPASWHREEALAALRELCATGRSEVPVYKIARNGRCGSREVHLGGSSRFVAEGIFAPEVVATCREEGLLAAAYCITQHPVATFWRRLTRDLREHRKPPLVLVRRGFALLVDQQRVVGHAVRQGCRRATGDEAYAELRVPQP